MIQHLRMGTLRCRAVLFLHPYQKLNRTHSTLLTISNGRHSHELVVVPTMAGRFVDTPASVKYQRHKNSTSEELEDAIVTSTARGMVNIMSVEEYNVHVKSHRQEWFIFTAFAFLLVILPYSQYKRSIRNLRELISKAK
jgi:hypothetical protein